ncbi:porin family protein [Photobacterium japonica]|uniref:outer membrane protein n=1 Tax=Photobacterium japonica TaxID=2910235 RepID=UPI003D0B01F8
MSRLILKHTVLSSALVLALFPVSCWADAVEKKAEKEAQSASESFVTPESVKKRLRYFAGVRGGASLIGNDDSAIFAQGGTVDSENSGIGHFGAFDIGTYMPDERGRVYYSFEYHTATTQFEGKDAYDTQAMLHLISADHFFQPDLNIRPFVGLHVGYAFAETDSDFPDNYEDSGIVFGVQAGLGWEVTQRLALEIGIRHTVLPSKRQAWQAETDTGDAVTVESQLKGVSSAYLGANYRF